MAVPQPELNDDLLAEILIHVGPDEPAQLFRASLVCKCWHRIITDPGFHCRYCAVHRRHPRLLGFVYNLDSPEPVSRFVPTTPGGFTLALRRFNDGDVLSALDCRHGRILFKKTGSGGLVVWDPIADVWTDLPPPGVWYDSYSAVVLCGVAGCDHRGCHGGRFLVVCIGRRPTFMAVQACVYSSEGGAWGTPVFDRTWRCRWCEPFDVKRPVVIGDGIYCTVGGSRRILKYDFIQRRFSWIDMPYRRYTRDPVLLPNEDGSLELAGVRGAWLSVLSRTSDAEGGDGVWVQRRLIKLRNMLPCQNKLSLKATAIGFAEGVGVLFISTNVGIFTVDLNSSQVMKVCKPSNNLCSTFPFISTFTP